MNAAAVAPAWKTALDDSFSLVLALLAIPLGILLIGTPIALVAALVIKLAGWFLQR
jgi:hypothetical protein